MQKDRALSPAFEILYYSCDYLPILSKVGVRALQPASVGVADEKLTSALFVVAVTVHRDPDVQSFNAGIDWAVQPI